MCPLIHSDKVHLIVAPKLALVQFNTNSNPQTTHNNRSISPNTKPSTNAIQESEAPTLTLALKLILTQTRYTNLNTIPNTNLTNNSNSNLNNNPTNTTNIAPDIKLFPNTNTDMHPNTSPNSKLTLIHTRTVAVVLIRDVAID